MLSNLDEHLPKTINFTKFQSIMKKKTFTIDCQVCNKIFISEYYFKVHNTTLHEKEQTLSILHSINTDLQIRLLLLLEAEIGGEELSNLLIFVKTLDIEKVLGILNHEKGKLRVILNAFGAPLLEYSKHKDNKSQEQIVKVNPYL